VLGRYAPGTRRASGPVPVIADVSQKYMRFFLTYLVSGLLVACATPSSKQASLVGRWRSDTAPTGYWVIDRYTDGRFAEKEFLSYDYKMPTEILVSWGRWRLKNNTYQKTIEGSTSPFVATFIGKTSVFRVSSLSTDHFAWENNEGYIRTEDRIQARDPLTAVIMQPTKRNPVDPDYIVKTIDIEAAPTWVEGTPQ